MAVEFKLPELGEGVEKGTVTKILVAKGDTISVDQPILEIETDKAVLEVPSSVSGTVVDVLIKEGDAASVGTKVLTVETGAEQASAKKKDAPKAEAPKETTAPKAEPEALKAAEPKPDKAPDKEPEAAPQSAAPDFVPRSEPGKDPVPAAPHVRGFAREIGIDINDVTGSGPGGRISIQDVKDFSKQLNLTGRRGGGGIAAPQAAKLPDFSRWGAFERVEMNGVRRRTAENMAVAWATIPHVTQFEKVDITELEKMRKQYGKRVEAKGGKLTITAILAKVLATALKKFPQFNASIDLANESIIYKQFYNIGIAADTDRGLLVPVLKNVDKMNLADICADLNVMAEKARARKLTIEEMQGATFTISNLGGIGGTYFTPIVNPPEVAILGVSRGVMEPVYQPDGTFAPRLMLPLSLSYDHRVIDGADAARFIVFLREVLEHPFLLFLES